MAGLRSQEQTPHIVGEKNWPQRDACLVQAVVLGKSLCGEYKDPWAGVLTESLSTECVLSFVLCPESLGLF